MPTPEQNLAGIFHANGYWWPAGCRNKTVRWLKHERDSDVAVRLIPKDKRMVAVQAGGSMGLWPLKLARQFRRIVTFEPEAAAWECLGRNTKGAANIDAHRALLGERSGEGTLIYNSRNAGGHKATFDGAQPDQALYGEYMEHGYSTGERHKVMAIDDLGLEGVALIYLDIEGAELPAFKGAVRTISRCRPVLAYEEHAHGRLHGYQPCTTEHWLRKAGYRFYDRVAKDRIWVPE